MSKKFLGKHVLIIVENLPVPLDRRVWQEALTLKENGAQVSVICPKMKGYNQSFEVIEGISIYRHYLPLEGKGFFGYVLEYSFSLFFELLLALKIYLKSRFHVIQGCNPPDLIFLVALPFKLLGVKYVFDHHDLNPELFYSKFHRKNLLLKIVQWCERMTFFVADFSIATNDSFKEIAVSRGGMRPERVEVVRSGPDLRKFYLKDPNPVYKRGRNYLVGYVGVIAEQDGLNLLMEVIKKITDRRSDVQFAILGDGTSLLSVIALSKKLGITEYVDFYGMVTDRDKLLDILNTCDVGVNPDLPDGFNDLVTSNKVMEYMALKKPVVQFDMKEGRYSAQDASLYVNGDDLVDFARKICLLLDKEDMRISMGELGYRRVLHDLSWEHESTKLVSLYARVLSVSPN